MKKLITLCLVSMLLISCAKYSSNTKIIDAEVLSIEEHILEGYMIGHFLGSPDGHITSDKIKVGISISTYQGIYLNDFELLHSELAYYRNENIIPLELSCSWKDDELRSLYIYLNSRIIYEKPGVYRKTRRDIKLCEKIK